ncbi:MAG: hypothetical protein Kow0059_05080 [Candidatus Sumerlaeia bacterium]
MKDGHSRTVIVTREEEAATGPLGQALRAAGLAPRHLALIESRRRRPDDPALEQAFDVVMAAGGLKAQRSAVWIVFSSRRAVEFWFEIMAERGRAVRAPVTDPATAVRRQVPPAPAGRSESGPSDQSAGIGGGAVFSRPPGLGVAAVGAGTAGALRARGWEPDVVPETARGEALAAALLDVLSGGGRRGRVAGGDRAAGGELGERRPAGGGGSAPRPVIIFPRAAEVAGEWTERLIAAGACVIAPVLYETVPVEADVGSLVDDAVGGAIGAVTFASPSAVKALAANLARCGRTWPPAGGPVMAAIGPTTAAALRAEGLGPVWESPAADFRSFARALAEALLQ